VKKEGRLELQVIHSWGMTKVEEWMHPFDRCPFRLPTHGERVLTKQISPLEMCPASRAGKVARGMIEQMSLQMLCPRKTPATSIVVTNEPLLSVLA
jgi:hypothetical protein